MKIHVINNRGLDNSAKREKKKCSALCRESVSLRGHHHCHEFKLDTAHNSQIRGLRPQSHYFKVSKFICHLMISAHVALQVIIVANRGWEVRTNNKKVQKWKSFF